MPKYATMSIGPSGEWTDCASFEEAKGAVSDYYHLQRDDAEETVILLFEGNTLLKAWERNSRSKWVRVRDEDWFKRIENMKNAHE